MANVRVRIAPSPTGVPHIGNTRTALFNYVFAKHHKGKFILRIEDTDKAREVAGAKEAILEILDWLGLKPDETYIQSERLHLYQKAAEKLVKDDRARREEGAIRFVVAKKRVVRWTDAIGNKEISFKTNDIEDSIILKSDGFPTYHLANVVDDHEMDISHVIRGDEWISSTPKHILLYKALGWEPPIFAHLPLILGPDKTKLSKRHGAESVLEYRNKGYLKEAIINFLMLLGWTHPEEKDIFSLSEAIELFDLKDVHTNAPIFDVNKLTWLNGHYIRQLTTSELKSKVKSQKSKVSIDDRLLDKIIPLAQSRMKTLNDFEELVMPFFGGIIPDLTEEERQVAARLKDGLSIVKQWNNDTILETIKNVLEKESVSMPVVYRILTGRESGLPLPNMLSILGKEKTLNKLGYAS